MKTIEDRLNEQLAAKENEIGDLREQIERLKRELTNSANGWTVPIKLDDAQTLPVPRLEISAEPGGPVSEPWRRCVFKYRLVYRAFWDEVLAIPLGRTMRDGGRGTRPVFDGGPNAGKVEMPHRDGAHICHDMDVFKLPGFLVCEDVTTDISHLAGKPHERW